ncbi:MAG: hypothetical protein SGI74_02595 [Oligoflexia bacterium]|nr:hypothetical protein [Oligoflexia bacterium]
MVLQAKDQLLTTERLKNYSSELSTNIFDSVITNSRLTEKSPVEQDLAHRTELLEIKIN